MRIFVQMKGKSWHRENLRISLEDLYRFWVVSIDEVDPLTLEYKPNAYKRFTDTVWKQRNPEHDNIRLPNFC